MIKEIRLKIKELKKLDNIKVSTILLILLSKKKCSWFFKIALQLLGIRILSLN